MEIILVALGALALALVGLGILAWWEVVR